MPDDHVASNDRSRARLHDLVARLSEEDLRRRVGDGWTVAAALAHLAFWDDLCRARWERYGSEGFSAEFPDGLLDLVNAAGLPVWSALPPAEAGRLALAAAEEVDRVIAALPPGSVRAAEEASRRVLLDRSPHRDAHIAEIEAALGA